MRCGHLRLLRRGCNADDLVGAWRQLLLDRTACATEQDRRQVFPQLGEILVAQHLTSLINNAVMMEKTKAGPQPPVVDELHHGIQLIQPILQRRPTQRQRKPRTQAFDDTARFRFPVLDSLPFINNDQIPCHPLNLEDIPQHLFIIADRKKRLAAILRATFG